MASNVDRVWFNYLYLEDKYPKLIPGNVTQLAFSYSGPTGNMYIEGNKINNGFDEGGIERFIVPIKESMGDYIELRIGNEYWHKKLTDDPEVSEDFQEGKAPANDPKSDSLSVTPYRGTPGGPPNTQEVLQRMYEKLHDHNIENAKKYLENKRSQQQSQSQDSGSASSDSQQSETTTHNSGSNQTQQQTQQPNQGVNVRVTGQQDGSMIEDGQYNPPTTTEGAADVWAGYEPDSSDGSVDLGGGSESTQDEPQTDTSEAQSNAVTSTTTSQGSQSSTQQTQSGQDYLPDGAMGGFLKTPMGAITLAGAGALGYGIIREVL